MTVAGLEHRLVRQWRAPTWAGSLLLVPASWAYRALVWLRRAAYHRGLKHSARLPVSVIVVGNITVGGSGKTPLVMHLVSALRAQGWRPGVVSRGYGGADPRPRRIDAGSTASSVDPADCGDEPAMIALHCACPVAVGVDRPAAAQLLVPDCDVVIADDGLQHYPLSRDLEVAVVDGDRGLGNGRLLPAGPLREPAARLREADFVAWRDAGEGGVGANAYRFRVRIDAVCRLNEPETIEPLVDWIGRRVHAVAGIGVPERFFGALEAFGLEVERHPFADHHAFTPEDLAFADAVPILMTEKDAVKCRAFADERMWVVPVAIDDPADLAGAIIRRLTARDRPQEEGNGSAAA